MDVFIGTIVPWPISYAPPYFAFCNGSAYQVNQYQAVYSLIGVTFGGSPNTSFNLPDLRGRAVVGSGNYMGGTPIFNLGQTGGANTATITLGLGNLPSHSHAATFVPIVGAQTIVLPSQPAAGSLGVAVTGAVNHAATGTASPSGTVYLGGLSAMDSGSGDCSVTGPYASSTTGGATLGGLSGSVTPSADYRPATPANTVTINAVTSGSVAVGATPPQAPLLFSNMQSFVSMNFLFALQGLYPMRP